MNYQYFLSFLTLLNFVLTAPIPMPMAEPAVVTVTNVNVVTATATVAEVLISNGVTYTIELTTVETEGATTTSSSEAAAAVTTSSTEAVTAAVATTSTEAVATTSSTSVIAAVAQAAVVDTTSTTSTSSSSTADCSTSVSVDSEGVAHVVVTLAQTVVVNGSGATVTTYDGTVDSTSTTPTTTTTSSTADVAAAVATTTTPTTTATTPITTSTSSTSEEASVYVTTWANGEVFYSTLPTTLVGTENVAPVVAFTTVTADTLTTTDSTGLLTLVTSDGSVLLGTLTEGLTKNKEVAATMANPETVSVTNTLITTTANTRSIVSQTTTSTSSTSSTELTSSSSTTSVTAVAVLVATSSTSGNAVVIVAQTSSSSSSSTTTTSTASSSSASASASSTSVGYLTKVPYSIVYSPYEDDGTCKDYSTVLSDLTLIKSKGISELRIYGNDCNYMTTVLKVSKNIGLLVNQGFWISSDGVDSIDDAVTNLITYVSSGAGGYSWEVFSYITIGNEAIISEYCTVDELIAKISSVKALLQAGGYTGKVTTAEPPVSYENNPTLCTASEIDFVGINPHSYFDTYSYASEAGTFVAGQIEIVQAVCGDLDIVVTETGYPNAGNVNGNNIPSAENQLIAVQSILDVVGTDVTILTTFEDLWKSPGTYNIEQHFGIIQLLE